MWCVLWWGERCVTYRWLAYLFCDVCRTQQPQPHRPHTDTPITYRYPTPFITHSHFPAGAAAAAGVAPLKVVVRLVPAHAAERWGGAGLVPDAEVTAELPLAVLAGLWAAGRLAVAGSALLGAGSAMLVDLALPALVLAASAREVVGALTIDLHGAELGRANGR